MQRPWFACALAAAALVVGVVLSVSPHRPAAAGQDSARAADRDRSPADVILTPDEAWLVTANATADTISLVRVATGEVAAEVPCGAQPWCLALAPDGKTLAVTARRAGELAIFAIENASLVRRGAVKLGFEPFAVAISPDGRVAYVSLASAAAVAVVDLATTTETDRIAVGRWPRYMALSPDGSRLAVGTSGDGGVSVVDTQARKMLFVEKFVGLNLGQMHASADGRYAYLPWINYGDNPITPDNIRRGWVTASRIGRVRLDEQARREAMALDPRGQAVGDPTGLALSPDERWLVATAAGTHELLVYKMDELPFQDYGGPGDHIDPDLLEDHDRFYRVPLGGRPMAVRFARDGRHAFVANYLANAVQVVNLERKRVERTMALGGPPEPSLARRGETIFYDALRSLDQWYSCHSCHYEGGTNSVTMDTNNDGTPFTFKTVLTLRGAAQTGPWTWHGWQTDFDAALRKSLLDTMRGPEPNDDDVQALAAFVKTLAEPASPHREAGGELSAAAERGQAVFGSDRAGCANCHSGPLATDGQNHDVGLGTPRDVYKGFNTPSLVGVHNRVRLLHDGRARTLNEVLTGAHSPTATGGGELSADELSDLIAYLKTL
ncbi:MAG: beta-propeller fold lactonase family protein [Planctomycetia bacterium]|nr:beta-propeller fold lactonase family protein [Planctomycetia bacterium]